jgi:hypothetical protein
MEITTALPAPNWRAIASRSVDGRPSGETRMEHRWGPRRPCRARVCVSAGSGLTGIGRLRDVSMSGAFLETALELPIFAQLAVAVLRDDGSTHQLEFPAVVVRHGDNGVGIEWCDPSPGVICLALNCGIDCGYARGQPA